MPGVSLAQEIKQRLPALELREQEPMKQHCSFRIGGPAEIFTEPASEEELAALVQLLRQKGAALTVIGNGSNLLVHDEGIRGVVIRLGERFSSLRTEENRLCAAAGITLAKLACAARDGGLAGLEFAHGIPGSLGGAVMMNAGAYGGELKDVVRSVRYLDSTGCIRETADGQFGYRHSRFTGTEDVVLGAVLELTPDDPAAIHSRMMELWAKRSASQPLELPSAGSTFKRPAGGYAAAMIDQAGLRGLRVGGAQVSTKHTGFIVNTGGATFADVTALMAQVQERVFAAFGVMLEPEVRIVS